MYAIGTYCKEYEKGKTINAIPGTFGIMTFDTHSNALDFLGSKIGKIIKVKSIGKGRRIKFVSANLSKEKIQCFYENQIYKNPSTFDLSELR